MQWDILYVLYFKILIKYFRQHLRSIHNVIQIYDKKKRGREGDRARGRMNCEADASNVEVKCWQTVSISFITSQVFEFVFECVYGCATFYADIVQLFAHASCISIISLKMDWWLGWNIPNLLVSIDLLGKSDNTKYEVRRPICWQHDCHLFCFHHFSYISIFNIRYARLLVLLLHRTHKSRRREKQKCLQFISTKFPFCDYFTQTLGNNDDDADDDEDDGCMRDASWLKKRKYQILRQK